MVNLVQLDLESVTYTDEDENKHKYTIIPVVTLTQDEIDKNAKTERRLESRWKKFYKAVTKNFKIAGDVALSDDESEPLKDYDEDEQYVFTDLTSLTALDFNERNKYDIGFRYVEYNEDEYQEGNYIAHIFSDEFVKKMHLKGDVESITKDIPFSHIQSTYEEVLETLNRQSRQNEKSLHEQYRLNKAKNYDENDNDAIIDDSDDENDNEEVEQSDDVSSQEESPSQKDEQPDEQEPIQQEEPPLEDDEDDYADDVDDYEGNTLQSDLSELRRELYEAIDNHVPKVYLGDIDIDLSKKYQDSENTAYAELENNAIDSVKTIKQREYEKLKDERQSLINRLYRKASSLLYKKFTDIEKLYLYESEESEFHNDYMDIYNKKEEVLESATSQYKQKYAELTRRFEEDMERRAKQAYEAEKSRIEREERHLVEEQAIEFKDDLVANAEELFNSQINNLMNDIDVSFEYRKYGIVDNVFTNYENDINKDAQNFKSQLESSIDKVTNKYNDSIKTLNEQIQDIEKDHIQNKTQFDEKVDLKVKEKTQSLAEENKDIKNERDSMKQELERLRESEKRNQATIDNLQLENQKKEERISVTEADAQFYRSRFEEHQQRQNVLGHNGGSGGNGNFSDVVAPNQNGEGNLIESVSTEKVEKQSLKDKLKSPLVATMIAVSVTTVGLFGASSFEHSKEAQADEQITHSIDNINQFKKTNSAKYLGNGTTLTIRADNRLKPSVVKGSEGDKVLVESEDGKEYKLNK